MNTRSSPISPKTCFRVSGFPNLNNNLLCPNFNLQFVFEEWGRRKVKKTINPRSRKRASICSASLSSRSSKTAASNAWRPAMSFLPTPEKPTLCPSTVGLASLMPPSLAANLRSICSDRTPFPGILFFNLVSLFSAASILICFFVVVELLIFRGGKSCVSVWNRVQLRRWVCISYQIVFMMKYLNFELD